MRFAVPLVWPEVQAVFVLAQVIGNVHVAQERYLVTFLFGPSLQFWDLTGEEVLVGHNHHRHGATTERFEHLAHALRVVARAVHDIFTPDVAFFSFHNPFVTVAIDARDRAETFDAATGVARPFRERLCQLSRVNVTVKRVPHATQNVVSFHERVHVLKLLRRADVHLKALIAAHPRNALKFLHPLFGMRETD